MKQTATEILDKAAGHMRDRAATYDKPDGERSMAQTVGIFNLYHGTTLTEAQGWHFMQILKDVRLFTSSGYHADSAEDAVAYAGLKAEALANEASEKAEQPEADGWIDWAGGVCPVPGGTPVEVQFRNRATQRGLAIDDHGLSEKNWGRLAAPGWPTEHPYDIVRYRVLS